MKKAVLFILFLSILEPVLAQDSPFLSLNIRRNFLNQKIDFLDGPKVLTKLEIQTLMAESTPETADLYRRAMAQQRIATIFSFGGLAASVGTVVFVAAPQQQSSQLSNLAWPFLIASVALEIGSGIFNRQARNLARESVDSFNLGGTSSPVYFEDNRIDVPLFSHIIRF